MKIYSLKYGSLNEQDRLEMARLLIKAGYTVRIGAESPPNSNGKKMYFVEFSEGGKMNDAQMQN